MKQAFVALFLLFAVLYVAAVATIDRRVDKNVVTLRWSTDANPARNDQVAVLHKLYPHVAATVDPTSGGDDSKLIVQCATGVGPDIIDIYSKQDMISLAQAGILLDLTPYAKKMGFDPTKTYPSLKGAIIYDGRQYRFPDNVWANCVVYNKKVFEDHNVPFPKPGWTYQDFVRTAEELQNNPSKSGRKCMAFANWDDTWMVEDLLVGYGGHFFSPDGLVCALSDKPAVGAIQFYHDLIYKYKVVPTPAEASALSSQGGWGSGGMDWFYSGKAAMMEIGRWCIVNLPQYPNLQGDLGSALLPRVGDRPSQGMTDTRAAGINVNSPHRKEALQFLQYLASPQYGRLIVQDGDSLPPDPDLAGAGRQLVDRYEPDPSFQQTFIQAERNARPLDSSPFIDPSQVSRWTTSTIQEVENNLQTPRQAMQALSDQINQQIRVNLRRRPDLQARYERITGKPYAPDWWRTHPAPPAGW